MATNLHSNELPVDESLVRRLVDSQLPEYADLPVLRLPASGSTNALFRLGRELLVRVPRQPGGTATIGKEARWLPHLREALPVAVPEVIAVGEPGHGYPERWSVVRWLAGAHPEPAGAQRGTVSRDGLARDLATLVRALRTAEVPPPAMADPALRWYRGDPITLRDSDVRADIAACRSIRGLDLDLDRALVVWEEAMELAADPQDRDVHWLHGDLVAENLLVRDERLSAVLDFGGLCVGDPTVDLVAAWELLDRPEREVFREQVDVDDRTWLLGRAWALVVALMTFPYYWRTMPERCANRLVMAHQVLADAA